MTPEEISKLEAFDAMLTADEELSEDERQELLHLIELAEIVALGEAIAAVAVEKRTEMQQ